MKDYIFLDRYGKSFYPMSNFSTSPLRFLAQFFATDYIFDDQDLFLHPKKQYNSTSVYNAEQKQLLYITPFDLDLEKYIQEVKAYKHAQETQKEIIQEPSINLCKISYDNFIQLSKKIFSLHQIDATNLVLYQQENDWIDCKGFNCPEKMKQFIAYQIALDQEKNKTKYEIEEISSFQIHVGFYSPTKRPRGAHSNTLGKSLEYFNPATIFTDTSGVKDLLLRNGRFPHLTKFSTVYPEHWSIFECDKKAIEVAMNPESKVVRILPHGLLKIIGTTPENIEIVVFYEMKTKKLRMHYPNIQ
ncbi:hypothetical protein KBC04_02635 [Candidatus Babeliales bacterium]|nr:hypothetical protein [Candidatus Babeliales bacterium]MBP9844051.1 hypothetical protein [Candidatus Babeliales bacterium]